VHTLLVLTVRAGWRQNVPAMRLLLQHKDGADVQAVRGDGASPLTIAAWVGHEAAVRLLLEHQADLAHEFDGDSALALAKRFGHRGVVEMLVEEAATRERRGAEPDPNAGKPRLSRNKAVS